MQRAQSSVVFLVIVIAVILAVGTFLAISFILRRADNTQVQESGDSSEVLNTDVNLEAAPPLGGGFADPLVTIVSIEGTEISVQGDPGQGTIIVTPEFAQIEPTPVIQEPPPVVEEPSPAAQNPTPIPQPTSVEQILPTPEFPTPTPVVQIVQDGGQPLPTPIPTQPTLPIGSTPTPIPTVNVLFPNNVVDPIIFVPYTVTDSDSLYNITRQLVTSIALMAQYGISQDDLVTGNTIQIPVGNPAYCPGLRPYAVGEGETAFHIAQLYGTTVETLRDINGLDETYTIRLADILCVP